MSIIAQPKTFPLEGDSSLKIQRGKWWIKDSSAIHVVPRLVVIKLPDGEVLKRGGVTFLHLELSNPRDTPLPLTLSAAQPPTSSALRITSSQEGIVSLVLGAFEDELLREEGEAESDPAALVDQQAKELLAQGGGAAASRWCVASAHNSAVLAVPVQLASSPTSSIGERPSLAIEIEIKTEQTETHRVLVDIGTVPI